MAVAGCPNASGFSWQTGEQFFHTEVTMTVTNLAIQYIYLGLSKVITFKFSFASTHLHLPVVPTGPVVAIAFIRNLLAQMISRMAPFTLMMRMI